MSRTFRIPGASPVLIQVVTLTAGLLVGAGVAGSSAALAGERRASNKDALPTLEKTGVLVPWEDFKKLLEEIRGVDPVPPPPPPPVDFALSECRATAEVAPGEEQVRVTLEFSLQVLNQQKWVEVPVIPEGAALSRFEIDGRPANVYRKGGYHQIALRGAGRHALLLEYVAPVQSGRGTRSTSFHFPRAPVIDLDLRIPSPRLDVNLAGAVVRSIERTATQTRVRAAFQQATNASVTWFKQVDLGEKETKVFGEIRTLLSIGEGMIRGTANAVYTIHGEGTDLFRVALPNDLNVLDVSAQGVREWKVENGKPEDQVLSVRLNYKAKGSYAFQISFEKGLEDATAETFVPDLVLRDVMRDRGFVAVAAATNVEISPNGSMTNATPVDPDELPPELIARAGQPILYGFKYLRHPMRIGLKITRHLDLAVKRTIVERARLYTYLSPEGKAITSARYTVKNNRKQYLRLTLPDGAVGWGAYLEDRPVKAARVEDGTILIPLKKTAGNGNGDLEPFDVELVYFQRRPAGGWGTKEFTGPILDVDAMEVQWHLFLPRDSRYFGFAGNLHPDEDLNRVLYVGTTAYNMRARDDLARLRTEEVGGKTIITDGRRNVDLDRALAQMKEGNAELNEKDLVSELRALGDVGDDAAADRQGQSPGREAGKANRLELELKKLARKGERAQASAEMPMSEHRRDVKAPHLSSQAWGYAGGGLAGAHGGRVRGVLPVRFGIPVDGLRLSFTGRILTASEAPSISMRTWPLDWVLSGPAVFLLALGLTVAILRLRLGGPASNDGAVSAARNLLPTLLTGAALFALFLLNPGARGPFWFGMMAGFAGFFVLRVLAARRAAQYATVLVALAAAPLFGPGMAHAAPPPSEMEANSPAPDAPGRAAGTNGVPRLPNLSGTEITLSWHDFKAVVERTYVPPAPEPPVPAEAFFRSAEYTGRLEPGLLTLDGTLVLEVLKRGWIRLPIGTGGTVLNFHGGGALLNRVGNRLEVLAEGPATYTLRASFAFAASSHPGENRLAVTLPEVPRNLLNLTTDPSYHDVEVESGLVYRTGQGRTYVALQNGSFAMKYTLPFRGTDEPIGEEVKLEPRVQLQAYQLLNLGEGVLRGVLIHDYNVRVAKVSHFDIDLPDDVVIFDSVAPGLESWKILQRDGQRYLRIKLLAPSDGTVRAVVHFEGAYDPDQGRVVVPRFADLEVERESGFVAIAAEGAEVDLDLTGKLLPADVSEMPPNVTAFDPNLISAYKYSGEPEMATVRIAEHDDAPVLTAIIESLNATAAVMENGTEATWIDLVVKNNRKQFLNFKVPGENVEIWSLMLNGQPAKPKRSGDDILVPLPRGEGEVASRISLVLLRRGAKVRSFGRVDPYLPTFDVPVSEALWTVYLPPGMKYVPKQNGFRPVLVSAPLVLGGVGSFRLAPGAPNKVMSGPVDLEEAAAAYADAVSESTARAQADQEARIMSQMKQKGPSRKGALPVRIAIPGGIHQLPRVTMTRMLIVGDEDNTFSIRVYPAWASGALQLLQRLLLLGSAILIGLRMAGTSSRRLFPAGIVAGLLGVLPYGGIGPVGALILWSFIATTTWGAVTLYRRLRRPAEAPA